MTITGWTVRESLGGNLYFSGMNADGKPIFEPPCFRTRCYCKGERAANAAIKIIADSGYEGFPEPYFLEPTEVEDAPPEPSSDKPNEAPHISTEEASETQEECTEDPAYTQISFEVLKPPDGWRILDSFGKKLALLYNGIHYAVRDKNGSSRLLQTKEEAAKVWCKERDKMLLERLEKMGGA